MVNTEYCTEYFFCSDLTLVEKICSALDIISNPNGLTYSRGQTGESIMNLLRQFNVDSYTDYIKVSFVFCNEYRLAFKWSDYIGEYQLANVKSMTLSIHDERSDNPGVWLNGIQIDVKPIAPVAIIQVPDGLDIFLGS